MKHLLIAALCTAALLCIALLLGPVSRARRDDAPGGFRDWVKRPDYKRAVGQRMAADEEERRSLRVPESIPEAEIGKMVDRLFVREDRNALNFSRLELVGAKAHSHLRRALADPRIAERFDGMGPWDGSPYVPLQRVAGLLRRIDEPLVVSALSAYVDHPDKEVRKVVAITLGEIGSTECGDAVVTVLGDPDDYVRSYAMMGIGRGVEAGRCTREFLDAVFPALARLLDRRDQSVSSDAPALLLRIDSGRALPILLSAEYFSVDNRELHHIVEALNAAGHRIPHERLLPLIEQLKPLIADHPYNYSYAAALSAYARNPDAAAETTFRRELASADEKVQTAASESLSILAGIGQPSRTVFEAAREHGIEALTEPQRRYYAVSMYDAEVSNGGHSQYFVNSTGDDWRIALAGLEAIGATERAAILREATGIFGRDGAPRDNDERHERLARFTERQDQALDDLDNRYYESKENVESLLMLYAIGNKEAFSNIR